MKLFLHILSKERPSWEPADESLDFGRIPAVGEYLATESSSPIYLVKLVVHTPFEREIKAEVWAVEIDMTQGRLNQKIAKEWSNETGIRLTS